MKLLDGYQVKKKRAVAFATSSSILWEDIIMIILTTEGFNN